jgi:hypothetical protein
VTAKRVALVFDGDRWSIWDAGEGVTPAGAGAYFVQRQLGRKSGYEGILDLPAWVFSLQERAKARRAR